MPRSTAVASMPPRLIAVRCPAKALLTGAPCTCTPRTLTRAPAGSNSNSSPSAMAPAIRVPVTTAPNPRIVNARSMGRRVTRSVDRPPVAKPISRRAFFNSSMPSPVRELIAIMGAPSRNDSATSSSASARANSSSSSSTRSFLVSTSKPLRTPSSRQISKCSRVCGITLSSAAITRTTASMPWAPASMFLTKRS